MTGCRSCCITQKAGTGLYVRAIDCTFDSSLVFFTAMAPPKTEERLLSRPKLYMAASVNVPNGWFLYVLPNACAQSSMTKILCEAANCLMASISADMPKVCWMIMALVLFVIFFATSSGLKEYCRG